MSDIGLPNGGAVAALAGWWASLKPLHAGALFAVAVAGATITVYRITENIMRAPESVSVLGIALDSTDTRVAVLEAVAEQNRADIQDIFAQMAQTETVLLDLREMLDDMFCVTFPMGSPSGRQCRLRTSPFP